MTSAPLSLPDDDLDSLIEAGEGLRVEFKESLKGGAPDRIREAICAFANDLAGAGKPGIVVVGLKDDGGPADIEVSDEMLRRLTDMKSDGNILPPPVLLAERRRHRGAEVAVVTVWPSDSPPTRCRGVVHVRSGPRRGAATAQDERILNERRQHGDRPFDIRPVPETGLDDLQLRRFQDEYLPNAVDAESLRANERTLAERLAAAKMIDRPEAGRATVVGLLTLGTRPRDRLPGAYALFLRLDGTELADPIMDAEEIHGPVPDILSRVDDKLKAHNRTQVEFVGLDTERQTRAYPLAALQQLVRNAVMHRAYTGTHAPVRVTWFNDRIEIANPGGPFGSVTAESFGQPGVTDYRNPNLAEAMRVLGYVQRFGMGILAARRELQAAGHPDIEFSVNPSYVFATVKARTGAAGEPTQ